jgi:hypothetical protein
VLRTTLRCFRGMVDGFSKCIEADLGSEGLESALTNAESIRRWVWRLVLGVLIAMSFASADSSPTAGLVDGSAEIVSNSFLLVGAAEPSGGRHPVEKLCDIGTGTRRPCHRASPAREYDRIDPTIRTRGPAYAVRMVHDALA